MGNWLGFWGQAVRWAFWRWEGMEAIMAAIVSISSWLLLVLGIGGVVTASVTGNWAWLLIIAPLVLIIIFVAPYKLWKEQHDTTEQLKEGLQPKLAVFIEPNPVPAGGVPTDQEQGTFWRLGVTNTSLSPIHRCYGEIIKCYRINENGSRTIPEQTWPRQGHGLPWGRGSAGTYEMSLGREQTAYLDYIMIPNQQSGILVVPLRPNPPNDRPNYTSYLIPCNNLEFMIAVGSKEQPMKPSVIKFTFEWAGASKSTITVLENTSPQDSGK